MDFNNCLYNMNKRVMKVLGLCLGVVAEEVRMEARKKDDYRTIAQCLEIKTAIRDAGWIK